MSSVRPVVLFDTRERHFAQNPYIWQLVEGSRKDVRIVGFSWTRALLGSYDLVHLHWPEFLVGNQRRPLRAAVMRCLFVLWLLRLRATSIPVVRTRHNEKPHETLGSLASWLLAALEARVDTEIFLSDVPTRSRESVVIPHPDFQCWIQSLGAAPPAAADAGSERNVLIFGLLRPYKRIEEAIRAFKFLDDEDLRLVIRGASPVREYGAMLANLCFDDSRILLSVGRVPDEELRAELGRAHLVVVPYPSPGNSGVALMALTEGVPILIRKTASTNDLRDDYGDALVRWLDDDDFVGSLSRALEASRPLEVPQPTERGLAVVCGRHVNLYRSLMTGRRSPSR